MGFQEARFAVSVGMLVYAESSPWTPAHPPQKSAPAHGSGTAAMHLRRTSLTSAANLLPALTECPAEATMEKHPSGFPLITPLGSQSEHHGDDSLTAFLKPH
jgi:hypothetical protein